jgi:hypothetical protein
MVLNSVDFFQNTGWGNTGTFTLKIFTNNPTGGPHCGSCTPPGTYDGPTTTQVGASTTGTFTAAAQTIQTLSPNVSLAPGKYWLNLTVTGTAIGLFDCTPAFGTGSNLWQSPFKDNTASHNVVSATDALKDGNNTSTGALFNMKFQVGSNNACSRLFICANENCATPVSFLILEITEGKEGNLVSWKTATEDNNEYFSIERSIDGMNFTPIGKIKGAGNSNSIKSYKFTDNTFDSNTSILYYRIKQTDYDGAISYSDKASIHLSEFTSELKIYPVPVNHGQEINIELPYLSQWTYKIIDLAGKLSAEGAAAGHDKIALSSHSLPSGVYVIEVLEGNHLYHGKIVVY